MFERHCEILQILIDKGLKNKTLLLYDAHPDADIIYSNNYNTLIETDAVCYLSEGNYSLSDYVNVMGKLDIINHIIWCRKDFNNPVVRDKISYAFFSQRGGINNSDYVYSLPDNNLIFSSYGLRWELPGENFNFNSIVDPNKYILTVDLDYFDNNLPIGPQIDYILNTAEKRGISDIYISLSYQGGYISKKARNDFWTYISKYQNSIQYIQQSKLKYPSSLNNFFDIQYKINNIPNNSVKCIDELILLEKKGFAFPSLYFILAKLLRQNNDFKRALYNYDKSYMLVKDHLIITNDYATLLIELGQFDCAKSLLEEQLNIHPGNVNVNCNLGLIYFYTNNYDKAMHYLLKAVKMNVISYQALLGLSCIYSSIKDPEALKAVNNGLNLTWDKDRKANILKPLRLNLKGT